MEAWQLKEERQILKPHEVQAGGENEDDSPEGQAGDLHETSGGRHSCLDLVWSWSLDNIAVTAVVLPLSLHIIIRHRYCCGRPSCSQSDNDDRFGEREDEDEDCGGDDDDDDDDDDETLGFWCGP